MKKEDLKIVFMGTPDFAVESLRVLVEHNYNIVGVVTMPDKPSGRGYKLQPSAVKTFALEHSLKLLQPEKLKDQVFIDDLKSLDADLQIVVAFRMLPEIVWDMPRLGTFNLHGSLLPQYRGAAPINWAIINGEKETGVTTFFLTHEIDTGKIILQDKTVISENENLGDIYIRLMQMGGKLVHKTVDLILTEKVESFSQDQLITDLSSIKTAPKIFKDTCQIDWTQSANTIHNLIRGLSPYPAAWSQLISADDDAPQLVKIYVSEKFRKPHTFTPGTIITDNTTFMDVAALDGFVRILEIQLAGKKRMKIADLLRGYKFKESSRFGN